MKIARLSGDTAFVYSNAFEYIDRPTSFHDRDRFVKGNDFLLKADIVKMYEAGEVDEVERTYNSIKGFDRVRDE
jgi:hypothetical protein